MAATRTGHDLPFPRSGACLFYEQRLSCRSGGGVRGGTRQNLLSGSAARPPETRLSLVAFSSPGRGRKGRADDRRNYRGGGRGREAEYQVAGTLATVFPRRRSLVARTGACRRVSGCRSRQGIEPMGDEDSYRYRRCGSHAHRRGIRRVPSVAGDRVAALRSGRIHGFVGATGNTPSSAGANWPSGCDSKCGDSSQGAGNRRESLGAPASSYSKARRGATNRIRRCCVVFL